MVIRVVLPNSPYHLLHFAYTLMVFADSSTIVTLDALNLPLCQSAYISNPFVLFPTISVRYIFTPLVSCPCASVYVPNILVFQFSFYHTKDSMLLQYRTTYCHHLPGIPRILVWIDLLKMFTLAPAAPSWFFEQFGL